ncbi:MAG: hypothetical protein CMD98_04635 [Gammaproteobacteria bacterium]|nr:hypothetical protein [Gammaproteobacteria bacterium]
MANQIKKILAPRWDNREQTRVRCTFSYEDGTSITASVTETQAGNPDWKQIFEEYKEEDIGDFIPNAKDKVHKNNRQTQLNRQKDLNEALFAAKLEAFEIPEVRDSKNRILKARVRKAKSLGEIYIFAGAIVTESLSETA